MSTAQVRIVRLSAIAVFVSATFLVSGCAAKAAMLTADGRHAPPATSGNSSPHAQKRTASLVATTLEANDARLSAALLALAAVPSAATHRLVAREYLRLGVRDMAHEHFTDAVQLDPSDAQSFDALARIWRDWGTAHLGLADAYRAVYLAPQSASAANTLGTLLQALGRLEDAKYWYTIAWSMDSSAWYALNNICYIDILTRRSAAIETCEAAVRVGGADAKTPKNNLALAYAASGDLSQARQWFKRAGPATADYNYGITLMGMRDYTDAVTALSAALAADPQSRVIADRLRQAREAATVRSSQ